MPNAKITVKDVGKKIISEYSFVLSFILLVIIAASVNKNFFTWTNISNIFVQSSMIGLIAMGMSMVISAGQIDISVGSQVAFIGGFGILDSERKGAQYVDFHGHQLDKKMLDLMKKY